MKKLKKVLTIVGVWALTECVYIAGKAQGLSAMHNVYPKDVDEFLDAIERVDDIKDVVPLHNRINAKITGMVTKTLINK